MLFNSLSFAVFLPIVFVCYWFIFKRKHRSQNILLLVSSYIFYGWWDWRFVFLLGFSTLLDYFSGIKIEDSSNQKIRKVWLVVSIGINLGFLAVFKYYNFFIAEFSGMLSGFGIKLNPWTLNIILPVGISFYTFHGLSYIIDVYNRRIKAVHNIVDYSLFVCYFPLLVAGPIERATHLLPQIQSPRKFEYHQAVSGLRQILWGLFKKIVIADNCAYYADMIFSDYSDFNGSTLLLGALFFTFQIYGDFSGYSDIALGTSRLFGIELLRNFAFPYFSRDIAEFWRRWHISLTTWFRDYVYIPLGGSKGSTANRIRNTFIIFLISGFWHGANWTFIAWGFLNAVYFLPLLLRNNNRTNLDTVAAGKMLPSIIETYKIIITFSLTVFAWIFFRSVTISDAISYIGTIFSKSFFELPKFESMGNAVAVSILIVFFISIEWVGREGHFALERISKKVPRTARWIFYSFILFLIGMYMPTTETPFIYFQF